MATRIASRLRHPTLLDEIKKVVVGLGDNIMMPPRPRLRRSAPVLRGLYLNDGGPEGMIFLEPRLLPALLISDELIRSAFGPGAVIDRPPGWELRSGLVPFGKRMEPEKTYDLLHCLFFLLAVCGGSIVIFYTIKQLLRERQRRLRRGRGADPGQGGGGGPGPDGPGPSGGWRFPPSRGLLHLMDTETSVAGPCGRGSRRFARTLGLLDLVGGGGMDDAEGDGQGPGDGVAGGEDQESDSNAWTLPNQQLLRETGSGQYDNVFRTKFAPKASDGAVLPGAGDEVSNWRFGILELSQKTDMGQTSGEVVVPGAGDKVGVGKPVSAEDVAFTPNDLMDCCSCPRAGLAGQEGCHVLAAADLLMRACQIYSKQWISGPQYAPNLQRGLKC